MPWDRTEHNNISLGKKIMILTCEKSHTLIYLAQYILSTVYSHFQMFSPLVWHSPFMGVQEFHAPMVGMAQAVIRGPVSF